MQKVNLTQNDLKLIIVIGVFISMAIGYIMGVAFTKEDFKNKSGGNLFDFENEK